MLRQDVRRYDEQRARDGVGMEAGHDGAPGTKEKVSPGFNAAVTNSASEPRSIDFSLKLVF